MFSLHFEGETSAHSPRVWVTINEVWICDSIYCPLIQFISAPH
jgi:hypothetical protein